MCQKKQLFWIGKQILPKLLINLFKRVVLNFSVACFSSSLFNYFFLLCPQRNKKNSGIFSWMCYGSFIFLLVRNCGRVCERDCCVLQTIFSSGCIIFGFQPSLKSQRKMGKKVGFFPPDLDGQAERIFNGKKKMKVSMNMAKASYIREESFWVIERQILTQYYEKVCFQQWKEN